MKILLVNDDGYNAPGIEALEKVFRKKGHEVWLAAPYSQMSGKSHAMTIQSSLEIKRLEGNFRYAFTGTPVDCILYSKRYENSLFPSDPDLVISGINNGYNIATDILYSGTCGAAREAVLCGFKAIAVSSEGYSYEKAAEYVSDNLDTLYSLCPDDGFLNLNFPHNFNGKAVVTVPGEVRYEDVVRLEKEENDTLTVRIDSVKRVVLPSDELTDVKATDNGCLSISCISIHQRTNEDVEKRMKEIFQ